VDLNDKNPALAGKTYTTVKLSAADIGMPKAERTYTALDFLLSIHSVITGMAVSTTHGHAAKGILKVKLVQTMDKLTQVQRQLGI